MKLKCMCSSLCFVCSCIIHYHLWMPKYSFTTIRKYNTNLNCIFISKEEWYRNPLWDNELITCNSIKSYINTRSFQKEWAVLYKTTRYLLAWYLLHLMFAWAQRWTT
jgi:hypothetical protein